MALYLVRHARAVSELVDRERPLAEEGWQAAERIGQRLAAMDLRIDRIFHSGVLRARQTAEVLARHLALERAIAPRGGLQPEDRPKPVAAWLQEQDASAGGVLIVTHLPFVDRLASLLIAGDEGAGLIEFKTATIAKLVRRPRERDYQIEWVLNPKCA
jgi:phosphohistidine phosphatase